MIIDFSLIRLSPHLPSEIIRLGCDLMNLFYVYDEYTDIANGEGADRIRDIVMDAFRHPEKPRPEGELLVGEMAREFVSSILFLPYIILPLTFKLLDSRVELCGLRRSLPSPLHPRFRHLHRRCCPRGRRSH